MEKKPRNLILYFFSMNNTIYRYKHIEKGSRIITKMIRVLVQVDATKL